MAAVVEQQVPRVARQGSAMFAQVGVAVLFGVGTVAQPLSWHLPLAATVAAAAAAGFFLLSIVVGVFVEAWTKRTALSRLQARTVDDLERLYAELRRAAAQPAGPAEWEDQLALERLRALLRDLLGGPWHAARSFLAHAAHFDCGGAEVPEGALKAAWQQRQRALYPRRARR